MKTSAVLSSFLLLFALIVPSPAIAERIEHHGHSVDTEASAQACLACHDGLVANHVSTCTVKCDFRTPHSISRPYPPIGKPNRYASLAELQTKGVKLENGKLTCVSCHNLKNPARAHLVRDEKGNLCTICHLGFKGAH